MKLAVIIGIAGLFLAPLASGQKVELKLDAIADKASDKAELDLDGFLLKLASKTGLGRHDSGGKAGEVKDLLEGLQAIHVRHYQFDTEGAYSAQDLEPLRKQVSEAAGWSHMLNVKDKGESAEIFVLSQGGKMTSCLILAAGHKELTVVHIVGTLTLAQVKEMSDSHVMRHLAELDER